MKRNTVLLSMRVPGIIKRLTPNQKTIILEAAMKKIFTLFTFMVLGLSVVPGFAETVTTSRDQTSVSLTIYNSDLALVRDARTIALSKGEQTLAFKEISSRIMPETALIKGSHLDVIEQNFEFDLLTPATLLNKYVGRTVTLARENEQTGEEKFVTATVLSAASGVVLKVGGRIETGISGRLIYPDVPANLREKPTLTMLVDSKKQGKRPFELSYLTRGLSWKADYVALLNADETRLDLKGWVTLTNKSGTGYNNAGLQLVAGDVNRVKQARPAAMFGERMMVKAASDAGTAVSEESLLEYHLYSVARPTTIKSNQSKQIALLNENDGTCDKRLVLKSGSSHFYWNKAGQIYKKKSVDVLLAFKNDKASGFGLPKPAGIVRVYKKDSRGFSQFVGEDRIGHTPENEEIELKLGQAFDVTADRRQVSFSVKKTGEKNLRIYESGYEIRLKNAKDREAEVRVVELLPGEWTILETSHRYSKDDASSVSWQIPVPAKGEAVLTFRVRAKM